MTATAWAMILMRLLALYLIAEGLSIVAAQASILFTAGNFASAPLGVVSGLPAILGIALWASAPRLGVLAASGAPEKPDSSALVPSTVLLPLILCLGLYLVAESGPALLGLGAEAMAKTMTYRPSLMDDQSGGYLLSEQWVYGMAKEASQFGLGAFLVLGNSTVRRLARRIDA